MNKSKWLVLAAALGMMAATGAYLAKAHQRMRLGAPGVKVGPGLLYDELGRVAASHCVLLPDVVLGLIGTNLQVTQSESDILPKDTTFGRKFYNDPKSFGVQTSVVLMGSDRTSIHDPHYCLTAQGWHIENEKTVRVQLPMDHPYPYKMDALKLTASRTVLLGQKPVQLKGIYIYWFVSGDRLTANQGARMFSIAQTMMKTGVLERWAYISYFATCYQGQEEATFEQLEQFIRASAPEFQTVAGPPASAALPVATR